MTFVVKLWPTEGVGLSVGRPDKGQSILGRFLPLKSRGALNSGIFPIVILPFSKLLTPQFGLKTWVKEGKVEFICSVVDAFYLRRDRERAQVN